jgi:hypothetical protein
MLKESRWHTHDAQATLASTSYAGETITLYIAQSGTRQLARCNVQVSKRNESEEKEGRWGRRPGHVWGRET